ncbi:MAG TPA: hypothetical protein VF615_30180 [Longimicrobiaceae bacterium]|jgi:hypothetical protein
MNPNVVRLVLVPVLALGAMAGSPGEAHACSRFFPVTLGEVFQADAIVRVTATGYATPPGSGPRTTGIPEATVRFRVEEVLRGPGFPREVVVNGYLTDRDDFNDVPLPYRFVRPGGRGGSCFANGYREGAQYLLFLRRTADGYTPYHTSLGPTNEQVRGADDPWVDWARAYLSPCAAPGGRGAELGEVPRARMEAMEESPGSDLDRYRHARCYVARFGAEGSRGERLLRTVDAFERTPRPS